MKGIIYANEVSAKCLVSGLGHDFVTIERDDITSQERWVECHQCGLTLGELERLEKECPEHEMKCIRCGYPMMKNRVIKELEE